MELRSDNPAENGRYKKIALDGKKADDFFIDVFLQAHEEAPKLIVIDLDATDDPLHGKQEGRFFHGYYREYCYLPLYLFVAGQINCRLRQELWLQQSSGQRSFIFDGKLPLDSELIRLFVFDCD